MKRQWMIGMLLLACCRWAAAEPVIDRVETGSSFVKEAFFEQEPSEETGTLHVKLGGDTEGIRYFEIPVEVWEEFKAADSKGAFYSARIRQQYERQVGRSREERFDSPLPIQTRVDALCAFNEECEPVVLECIGKSRRTIRVAAYAFTRTRIAAALVDAHRRGVAVEIKADAKQAEYVGMQKLLEWFRKEGIPVTLIYTSGRFSAMHNKFMVFDERWVVTGSYNFTTTAQVSNWENLVWLDSPEMAEQYLAAWSALVSDEIPKEGMDGEEAEAGAP